MPMEPKGTVKIKYLRELLLRNSRPHPLLNKGLIRQKP
jgi:hypothetical protein